MFQNFLVGLMIHEAVSYLASLTPADWAAFKNSAMGKVKLFVHPTWLASEAGAVVFRVCDALAAICESADSNESILKALAAKDFAGAEAAALAELIKALPEVAPIVQAATSAAPPAVPAPEAA